MIKIKSFVDYLTYVESLENLGKGIVLFRGQSDKKPLLPSVCRDTPEENSTGVEKVMLEDLKRRSLLLMKNQLSNDWDWLVYAQHFGMKTRLLDWTSNPLTALWFACQNEYKMDASSYVYVLQAKEKMIVNLENDIPFEPKATRILKPNINNERIVAQDGWFTVHRYSRTAGKFVELEKNKEIKGNVTCIEIPKEIKGEILKKLSVFGVNNRTVFPDISGLCNHLNWKYLTSNER